MAAHELSVTRHIAAPPEKVWDVLADRTDEWWCPLPWRARHWSEEAMNQHREMGFEQGWNACTDQLQALCEG